tara:strand:+ start:7393 stop:8709 length:1317 start_codon:yes stop_codon:yes gene_type:complete
MKFYIGTVVDNKDPDKSGVLQVKFPDYNNDRPVPVAYTSPYYKFNSGGFVAVPEGGTQVLCLYNESPKAGESTFYYLTSVIGQPTNITQDDQNENVKPLRSNDTNAPIYGKLGGPVSQTFTNTEGNGLYITTEYSGDKIPNARVQAKAQVEAERLGFVTEATRQELEDSVTLGDVELHNNVTMKLGSGEEVNVGSVGVQIRNGEGDCLVLNSGEPNEAYSARSMVVETRGPQLYKCVASDINMKVVDGGDINIENDSTGLFGLFPWTGNIRLKSRYRDITLAALGGPIMPSDIHIVTNFGKIKLDGTTGQVTIFSPTDIQLNSEANISLNAGGNISLNSGGLASINANGTASINGGVLTTVGSNGTVALNAGSLVAMNGNTIAMNNEPITTVNPTGGDVSVVTGLSPAPAGPQVPAVPVVTPPLPNAYGDGTPAGGAV